MLISGLTFLCLWRCVKVSSHTAIHVDTLNDVPPYLGLYFVKMPINTPSKIGWDSSLIHWIRKAKLTMQGMIFDGLCKSFKFIFGLMRPMNNYLDCDLDCDAEWYIIYVKFVIFIIITFFIALSVHCKKVEVLNFKSVLGMWNNISTPLLTHLISRGHLLVIVRSFTELYFNSSDMGGGGYL